MGTALFHENFNGNRYFMLTLIGTGYFMSFYKQLAYYKDPILLKGKQQSNWWKFYL